MKKGPGYVGNIAGHTHDWSLMSFAAVTRPVFTLSH